MHPIRIGIIGCGAISGAYLSMARNFNFIEVAACADLLLDRAKAKAAEFAIPKACSVDDLLNDPSIELVLNLTIPKAHAPVTLACLQAGKHVYAEKPLATTREDGQKIMELAASKRLTVGCAPDTFMGSGIQTARQLIESGAIGRPVGFTAFMMCPGHESWHPSPEFYYQVGGGPMMDMGPYYLTALLQLLGPVKRITGAATVAIPQRTITHKDRSGKPGPKFGQQMTVETPDHVCGTIEFESGCAGVIVQTFAANFGQYDGKYPITIYGTHGTLKIGDPNTFDGPLTVRRLTDPDFAEVPPRFVTGYGRCVGAADQALAIRSGRPFRASGQQALYVLDLMQGFLDSSRTGHAFNPAVPYQAAGPMRSDLPFGQLEP